MSRIDVKEEHWMMELRTPWISEDRESLFRGKCGHNDGKGIW